MFSSYTQLASSGVRSPTLGGGYIQTETGVISRAVSDTSPEDILISHLVAKFHLTIMQSQLASPPGRYSLVVANSDSDSV